MGAVRRKRSIRWPFEHGHFRIVFSDPPDRFVHVIDVEVMQSWHIPRLSSDHGDADIAVADAHGVIGPDRFLFFFGAGLRSLHVECRFIELCLAHEVLADDGEVLNSGEHKSPFGRMGSSRSNRSSSSTPSLILPRYRGRKEVESFAVTYP